MKQHIRGMKQRRKTRVGLVAGGLVRRGWADVPRVLTHQDDVHPLWHEQELMISQSCGWPLVDELVGKVATILRGERELERRSIAQLEVPRYRPSTRRRQRDMRDEVAGHCGQ